MSRLLTCLCDSPRDLKSHSSIISIISKLIVLKKGLQRANVILKTPRPSFRFILCVIYLCILIISVCMR